MKSLTEPVRMGNFIKTTDDAALTEIYSASDEADF